ncbi:MAG: hypothetical protein Q9M91_03330 [Candidatus Dojkabacteria bacterium]|nr:hypothetical protein [Candidatus Dojkabacteria bacterium]MDQ7020856.1 hypothetical protein [Candidatus Dojkabacteria bacterium]
MKDRRDDPAVIYLTSKATSEGRVPQENFLAINYVADDDKPKTRHDRNVILFSRTIVNAALDTAGRNKNNYYNSSFFLSEPYDELDQTQMIPFFDFDEDGEA